MKLAVNLAGRDLVGALTLWRIDGNGAAVQALLVPPIGIPSQGPQAHGGQKDTEAQ